MRNGLQTADRVLQILTAFRAEGQELTVGHIADSLRVHKSTASRLAATLVERGFLERTPENRALRLGPEIGRLGLLALNTRGLVRLARTAMVWLSSKTSETVHLAVLKGSEVVNIAQVDGPHIVGIGNWVGRRTQLHCVANGKVFLVFAGKDLIHRPLEGFTPRTITSIEALRLHLKAVRTNGWAWNTGELEEGLHAVAVPVFDALNRCRAALSVSGPAYRLPPERFPELAQICKHASRDIGFRLGKL